MRQLNTSFYAGMGKTTSIISGLPGIGKTYLMEQYRNNKDMAIKDSDSSFFRWHGDTGVENPEFPGNYIDHIKDSLFKFEFILVSSHETVRKALSAEHLLHYVVYPERHLKKEYLQRYFYRGADRPFLDMMDLRWNEFLNSMEAQENCHHVILQSGEYLSDRIF